MTKCGPVEVTCTTCNTQQTVTAYDSLNVSLDPNLKKEFLEGKINFFTCIKCNTSTWIDKPLFYHDMNLHFCANLIPRDDVFNDDYMRAEITSKGQMNFEIPDLLKDNPAFDYFANPHIVLSLDEMFRYVIFRDRVAFIHARPEEPGSV